MHTVSLRSIRPESVGCTEFRSVMLMVGGMYDVSQEFNSDAEFMSRHFFGCLRYVAELAMHGKLITKHSNNVNMILPSTYGLVFIEQ